MFIPAQYYCIDSRVLGDYLVQNKLLEWVAASCEIAMPLQCHSRHRWNDPFDYQLDGCCRKYGPLRAAGSSRQAGSLLSPAEFFLPPLVG